MDKPLEFLLTWPLSFSFFHINFPDLVLLSSVFDVPMSDDFL